MNFNFETPTKAVYKFHEITSITGVKPYVLRFWETEFSQIAPSISSNGEKIYSSEDLDCIQKIKKLLFEDKLSIPEAKNKLSQSNQTEVQAYAANDVQTSSEKLKQELEAIIEKNSAPKSEKVMTTRIETKPNNFQLSNQDIINLVTAKKKLSVVLTRIDQIVDKHHW